MGGRHDVLLEVLGEEGGRDWGVLASENQTRVVDMSARCAMAYYICFVLASTRTKSNVC